MKPWWNRGCAGIQPCWMLVLFLLVLLLLALLPILARAEGIQLGCEIQFVDGSRQFIESCVTVAEMEDVQSLPYVSTPCQVKMEAAMKAMNPYVGMDEPWLSEYPSLTLEHCPMDSECYYRQWIANAEFHLAQLKKKADAMQQWEAVKKECWSKP